MGPSPWQLVVVLVIVLLVFGTKKLRGAGGDLGSAIKNFKKDEVSDEPTPLPPGFEWTEFDIDDDEQVEEIL